MQNTSPKGAPMTPALEFKSSLTLSLETELNLYISR